MVTRYVFRLYLFGLALLAGFGVLLWRLWVVQIEDHKKYVAELPQADVVVQRVPGIRGEIKDRNGVPLAVNDVSYEIKLDLREIHRLYRIRHKKAPTRLYEVTDRFGTKRQREEADIFQMFVEDVAPQLEQLGLLVSEDMEPLAEEMRRHYRTNRGVIPYTYRAGVNFDQVALVAEQSRFLEGVSISKRTTRRYPFGALLGHVLGYVRQQDDEDLSEEERKYYDAYELDDKGIAGVELTMDNALRPRAGQRVFPKDEHGKIVYDEVMSQRREPIKGHDVYLTIDIRAQYIAETALREAKIGRGAVVVMDPDGGEVLAMSSVPNFDPNHFIPSIDEASWQAYNTDKAESLRNRAISAYVPGSIYKVPIALAGCVRGQSKRIFPCGGGMQFGAKFSRCMGQHGSLGLSDGLMRSCNGFFFRFGIATGIRSIDKVGDMLLLGQLTGIELPAPPTIEYTGMLPSPDQLNEASSWTESETAYTSIGQGMVLATPLQMCNIGATVANGGICYQPRLVLKTHDHGENIDSAFPDRPHANLLENGLSAADLETVRKGMWKVVQGAGGTARGIRSTSYEIAGKTGTAQAWRQVKGQGTLKDYKTWFLAYAPAEKPKYAVCVFVENGLSGGGTTAPIAARIFKQLFAMSSGVYTPALKPLDEAKGHFDPLERTVYPDDPVDAAALALAAQDSDELAEAAPPSPRRPSSSASSSSSRGKKTTPAKPKIKTRSGSEGGSARPRPQPAAQPENAPAPRRNMLNRIFRRGEG